MEQRTGRHCERRSERRQGTDTETGYTFFFFKCNITNTSAICKRLSHAALLRDVDVNKALELFFDTLRKAAEKENLLIKTVLWVGKNAETIEKV